MLEELCFGLAASILTATFGSFVTENWFFYLMTALVIFQVWILSSGGLRNPNLSEYDDEDNNYHKEMLQKLQKRKGKHGKENFGVVERIRKRIHLHTPRFKRKTDEYDSWIS